MTQSAIHGREVLRVQKDVTDQYGTYRITRSYWEDGFIRERRDQVLSDGTVRKDSAGWRDIARLKEGLTVDAVRTAKLANGWTEVTNERQAPAREPNPNAIDPSSPLARLARLAFPNYHGRRYAFRVEESVRVFDFWDGGSRTYLRFVGRNGRVLTSEAMPNDVRQRAGNPFNLPIGEAKIAPGTVAVEHVIFCGKDLGLRVIVHPSDASGNLLSAHRRRNHDAEV